MSLRVKYLDVPEGAQEAAQVAGQGQPFSAMELVAFGAEDVAYATFEPEGWPLNGSRKIIPDDLQTGFWSETVSDSSTAEFSNPPVITMTFPEKYSATGISIIFSPSTGEWCTEIVVSWYRGTALLAQETTTPIREECVIQKAVESFDKVVVKLRKTNIPGHFAKVQMIEIGQTYWFGPDEIASVHLVNEIDPFLSELTVDTMKIDIHDRHARVLNPQKNQKIELYKNHSPYAVQYLVSSERQGRQYYTFSCQSAIGLLDDDYLGGIYESVSAETLLTDILQGFELEIDESFRNSKITGYLPICTRREALQQVAFALGAVVTTQASSKIRINPLPSASTTSFAKEKIFYGGKVQTEPRVAQVEIVAHKYKKSNETETLVDAEEISGEDVLITFAEPHYGYQITGGTIKSSGANWVTVTATGAVTITGKKYLHTTIRRVKKNAEATAAERNNIYVVDNATLVHSENVSAILTRLYNLSLLRKTLTQDAVIEYQRAGQIATSETPWDDRVHGHIVSMESDLTSTGHTATVTILGKDAPT